MEFQDYASKEAHGLIAQLLAGRSDSSVQHLRTIRDALDAAARALESPPPFDREVQELADRLTEAAADDVRRVQEDARSSVDAVRRDLDDARTELSDLNVRRDRLQDELHAARDERERLETSLAETQAAAEGLRADAQTERERADAADRDLAVTVEAHTELENEYRKVEAECRKLEGECRKAEAAARDEAHARGAVDEQLQDVRGLLDLALAEAARFQAQLEQQTSDSDAVRSAHGAIAQELFALRESHDRLDAACRTADEAVRMEAAARAAVEDALQETRGLLDVALNEAANLRTQIDAGAAETWALRGELDAAGDTRAERDAVEFARVSIAAELDASRARVEALEIARAQHDDHQRQLQAQLDLVLQSEASLRDQAAGHEREKTGVSAEAWALRGDVDRMVSLLDASVRAVDDLAGAATITDLLATLGRRLSAQFSRVALFRVKGNRLEGEHHYGFDQTTDVTKLVIPLSVDSLLTRVVTSGSLERLTEHELAERGGTPFGGAPFSAVALPLALQDETLAVVYAEHADPPGSAAVHESSMGFARLLAAQTIVLLMRHTQELKMLAELRDYAQMLLQEAEHMYSADSEAGKSSADLRKRLKDNLDCARQLYGHRAAMEGPAAAALFEEHIASAIDASGPFAKDLAAIVEQSPVALGRTG